MNLFSISEIKISYNPNFKPSEQPKIKSSEDAYHIFNQQWDPGDIQHRESFAVLLLNRANNVIGIQWVSKGGTAGTVADPKMIFQTAWCDTPRWRVPGKLRIRFSTCVQHIS